MCIIIRSITCFSLGQSGQPVQEHTFGSVVGHCDHDHRGIWRCGAQDLSGHVRGRPLCSSRCADHRPARARHREQFLHVLLSHSGLPASGQLFTSFG